MIPQAPEREAEKDLLAAAERAQILHAAIVVLVHLLRVRAMIVTIQNQDVLQNFQAKEEEVTQKIFLNHAKANLSAAHRINRDFLHAAKNHLVVRAMTVTIQNQDALRNSQVKEEVNQKILNHVAAKHLAAQPISPPLAHAMIVTIQNQDDHFQVRVEMTLNRDVHQSFQVKETIQNQEDHLSSLVIAIQNQDARVTLDRPIMRSPEAKDVIRVHAMTAVIQNHQEKRDHLIARKELGIKKDSSQSLAKEENHLRNVVTTRILVNL